MIQRSRPSAFRLARRSLGHRRGQTLVTILVSALISGTVIFASGYQAQVQQTLVDAAFAPDGPGNAWMLSGVPGSDLGALLPRGSERLTKTPVAGRLADLTWTSPRFASPIKGTLAWRSEICRQLIMVAGRCPSAPGEVAVSATDAAAFRVQTADRLDQQDTIGTASWFRVSGVYRPRNPQDPFWFENPPNGRSGFDTLDRPRADQLITVRDQFRAPGYLETLDVRVDHAAMRTDDLRALGAATRELADAASHHQARLVSSVPASLTRVADERARVVGGLSLTLAQLGALVLVVIALLASVALFDQRTELGLGRLRGEQARALRRLVVQRWAAVISAGWLMGWAPGLGLLAILSDRLPGQHGLPLGPALLLAPLAALLITIAVIVPGARSMLAQPVISLLRAAPSTVRHDRGRQLLIDVAVLMLAMSGLLVAVQAGTASVLGLLVPSLLAIGVGVLLVRAVVQVAAARRLKLSRGRVRPGSLLVAILVLRLRGLRIMMVATCLAMAFAIFAVQVQAIGAAVRQHYAAVTTGAAAVLQVDGQPAAVAQALDQLDLQHDTADATLTEVVLTRREDSSALRGMFVEPDTFPRVALGADRAADDGAWRSIAAPRIDPISFAGAAVTVEIAAHLSWGRTSADVPIRTGTRAELGIDYLTADETLHSLSLGRLRLAAGAGQRFRQVIGCQAGCRLLRVTLTPDGPMRGLVRLTSFGTESGDAQHNVDLGRAEHWQPVPGLDPESQLRPQTASGGLSLMATSGGGAVAVQHAWAPAVLPVLLATGVQLGGDPTLATPDGRPVPIRSVARAVDAIPAEIDGVAVGDLESVLRAGHGSAVSATTVQVWVSAAAIGRLNELGRSLAARGLPVVHTDTLQQALTAQQATASALSGKIAPGLALLSAAFAALGIGLTVAGQRAVVGRNLAALRLAGVRQSTLRRSTITAYLGPVALAVLLGAIAGSVGCALVIGGLPLLPTVQPAIHTDLSLRPAALIGSVVVALVVILAAVLVSVRWLLRGGAVEQLRSPR